jgi:hypothetical protein
VQGVYSKPYGRLTTDDSSVPSKCCTKCNREYPATFEYFSKGAKHWCKQCRRDYYRQYRADRRRIYEAQGPGSPDLLKRCSKCNLEFPSTVEFFFKRPDGKDGLSSRCKKCAQAATLSSIKRNRDGYRNYHRNWRANNRDKSLSSSRKYNQAHREERAESQNKRYWKNAEANRQRNRLWRKNHPEAGREWYRRNANYRFKNQRRRAKKNGVPNTLTHHDWQQCLSHFNHCCTYCGTPPGLFKDLQITMDHWIPLDSVNCPGTVPENVVPACVSCNSSKRNRNPCEWVFEKFGPILAAEILARVEAYFEWVKQQG